MGEWGGRDSEDGRRCDVDDRVLPSVWEQAHVRRADLVFGSGLRSGPAAVLLGSAATFSLGVFPRRGDFSLDLPASIEAERSAAISRHATLARIGFGLFAAATVASVTVVIWAMSVQAVPAPTRPLQVQ